MRRRRGGARTGDRNFTYSIIFFLTYWSPSPISAPVNARTAPETHPGAPHGRLFRSIQPVKHRASPLPLGEEVRGRGLRRPVSCRNRTSVRRQATPPLAPPPRGGGFERCSFRRRNLSGMPVFRQGRKKVRSGALAAQRGARRPDWVQVRNTGQAAVFPAHLPETKRERLKKERRNIIL